MKTKEYSYPSKSKLCTIKAWQWCPDNENDIKAVLQIHHGMAEHCGRYKACIDAFVKMGYAVFMNDMINHGKSNSDKAMLGHFGNKDGHKDIIADAKTLMDIAKKEYPDKPYIICGHSMGSMVMRNFINFYGNCFDGAVFIGTSGSNPLAKASIFLTNLVGAFKGKTYKSQMLQNLAFGPYDKPFEHRTHYDWGSRDKATIDDYVADEYCGFLFSAAGYQDLARLVMLCNTDEWANNIKKDMPVLLISGSMDPVGNYEKGVKEVYDRLISTGHTNVQIKLYPGARHEILNEQIRKKYTIISTILLIPKS
ncbi:MAG: alpha/beta hydrolase [Clostridiales bacterium]|nr:alpha/beta hydrolase [Clostridiales bacterium]